MLTKNIEGITVNIFFSRHSKERLNRREIASLELTIDDIIPTFYGSLENGDSLIWGIQDYLRPNQEEVVILIDELNYISLVVSVFYDTALDELNFKIITIWDRLDIRTSPEQIVLKVA